MSVFVLVPFLNWLVSKLMIPFTVSRYLLKSLTKLRRIMVPHDPAIRHVNPTICSHFSSFPRGSSILGWYIRQTDFLPHRHVECILNTSGIVIFLSNYLFVLKLSAEWNTAVSGPSETVRSEKHTSFRIALDEKIP
jgi:hypothetical protein